jgi:hypothetical protein
MRVRDEALDRVKNQSGAKGMILAPEELVILLKIDIA